MPWYQAPAKINLGLWVGPRDIGGLHPVDTMMQTVTLSDQLYLEPRDHMLWESSAGSVPMDDQNLVVRAYLWCRERVPDLSAVYGRLEKVIPAGAGLGGGSSDAAAVIRWALKEAPQLNPEEVARQAGAIGMDVPFFVRGGSARAQGYGEMLTPARSMGAMGIVLANPGVALSTALVYQAYDRMGRASDRAHLDRVMAALNAGAVPAPEDLVNDLEEPACQVMPDLRSFRELVRSAADGAVYAMSGSGPTYYVLGEDEDWAEWMARRLKARGVPWAQPTTVLESW